MVKESVFDRLKPLATEDYQKRHGNYPSSNVPDSIRVEEDYITMDFKNTSESTAAAFMENFLNKHDIKLLGRVQTDQTGDYKDDWVEAYVRLEKLAIK